jgi:hypothetical protein
MRSKSSPNIFMDIYKGVSLKAEENFKKDLKLNPWSLPFDCLKCSKSYSMLLMSIPKTYYPFWLMAIFFNYSNN